MPLACLGFGGWRGLAQYAVFWVVPMLTVLQPILRLRAIAEHGGVLDLSSPLTAARSNRTGGSLINLLARAAIFPHHVNYHLEHHLYPAVPHYRLPQLHRLMVAKGCARGRRGCATWARPCVSSSRPGSGATHPEERHERDRPASLRRLAVLGKGAPRVRHEGLALEFGRRAGDAAQARRRRADGWLPAHALHADRCRHLLRLGVDVPRGRPPGARAAALSAGDAGPRRDRRPVGRHGALLDGDPFHHAARRHRPCPDRRSGRVPACVRSRSRGDESGHAPGAGARLRRRIAGVRNAAGNHARRRPAVPARRLADDRGRRRGAIGLVRARGTADRRAPGRLPAPRPLVRARRGVRPWHPRQGDCRRGDRTGTGDARVRRLRRRRRQRHRGRHRRSRRAGRLRARRGRGPARRSRRGGGRRRARRCTRRQPFTSTFRGSATTSSRRHRPRSAHEAVLGRAPPSSPARHPASGWRCRASPRVAA